MCIYWLSFILLFATKHYFYCSIVYIHCDFFVIRKCNMTQLSWGPSWSWSYGSWIYNYLRNQCLSPLKLWIHGDTTLYDKVCQWLVTGRWFSLASSTNKTELHDITEIMLKVALSNIKLSTNQLLWTIYLHNTFTSGKW